MNQKFPFEHKLYKNISELPAEISQLLEKAEEQLSYSYAPYSQFHVGAAALLDNGDIIAGCNQENASYPLCMCAERVALYNIGAQYQDFKIIALAITAHNPNKQLKDPCMPCGACRQVISEFEQRQGCDIPLYLSSKDQYIIGLTSNKLLLPSGFSGNNLL